LRIVNKEILIANLSAHKILGHDTCIFYFCYGFVGIYFAHPLCTTPETVIKFVFITILLLAFLLLSNSVLYRLAKTSKFKILLLSGKEDSGGHTLHCERLRLEFARLRLQKALYARHSIPVLCVVNELQTLSLFPAIPTDLSHQHLRLLFSVHRPCRSQIPPCTQEQYALMA
jgi:hypothetical protein